MLGLLLGEGEDLLDARAEVAEGHGVGGDPGTVTDVDELGLQPLHLKGQRLDLGVRLFTLGSQRGDFGLDGFDVLVHLPAVVPPEGLVEGRLAGRLGVQ